MAAAPVRTVAISLDEEVTMRQVRLRTGEGTIVHDLNEDGGLQRTTLVWSTGIGCMRSPPTCRTKR